MSRAQSGRSWHTAKEDVPPLPRSRSKSTHDLASLATSKNLVEQLEKQQGEGWWSIDKSFRRASTSDNTKSGEEDEDDRRLAALERLAKSSTLSHRERFPDPESPSDTPTKGPRSATSMDFRTRQGHGTRHHQSLDEWRPSTIQPRQRAVFHGPRPSLVAGSTWMDSPLDDKASPRRRAITRRTSVLSSKLDDETPTRAVIRRGPFVSSRISPDIARRASWIARRHSEMESSAPSSSQSPSISRRTTSTSITVPSEDESSEDLQRITRTRARLGAYRVDSFERRSGRVEGGDGRPREKALRECRRDRAI